MGNLIYLNEWRQQRVPHKQKRIRSPRSVITLRTMVCACGPCPSRPRKASVRVLATVFQDDLMFDATLALKKHWGSSKYREGQWAAVEAIFARNDVFVTMSTGHGKSLIYQLPSIVLNNRNKSYVGASGVGGGRTAVIGVF